VDAGGLCWRWLSLLTQQQCKTRIRACLLEEASFVVVVWAVDLQVAAANAANTHHAVYFEASDWGLAQKQLVRPASSAV
jgi:hypothetical protein